MICYLNLLNLEIFVIESIDNILFIIIIVIKNVNVFYNVLVFCINRKYKYY